MQTSSRTLHFGLSPSPSSPATKQGCFLFGFSSPGDFTRAYREALGEVNKRSSENPFTGSSKVSGGPGCRAKSPAVGTRGLRVAGETCRRPHRGRPRRISSGTASMHKDAHCHRWGTEVSGRGPGAQTRAAPRRRSVLEYRGERPGEAHVCKVELVRAPRQQVGFCTNKPGTFSWGHFAGGGGGGACMRA